MKKFLLTAALILSLVVSLTAGTMAAYKQEVAVLSSEVSTKQMFVSTEVTQDTFAVNFNIAPGDRIVRDIDLTYQGEIPADTDLVAQLTGSDIPAGVNLTVTQKASVTGDTIKKVGNRVAANAIFSPERKTETYTVTVDWPYDTNIVVNDSDDTVKAFTLKVDVNAKSVDENRTNGDKPPKA